MTAYFMVRAMVEDPALRKDFDSWYRDEHLRDALQAFNARRLVAEFDRVWGDKVTRSRDVVELVQALDR